VGTLKCSRSKGKFADSVDGKVAETRYCTAAEAAIEGTSVAPRSTIASVLTSRICRITTPGYRALPGDRLTIGLRKRWMMAIAKTMGVIVVVLLVLWLIFAVVGVLTAIIKSILGVLIVVAICYAVYHYLKKH
jgi:hypothetical protein